MRLGVTDSSPSRYKSGPSLTREGELFELNVGVGEQEVVFLGSVPRRVFGSFLCGAEEVVAWGYGLIPLPLLSPEKGSFLS